MVISLRNVKARNSAGENELSSVSTFVDIPQRIDVALETIKKNVPHGFIPQQISGSKGQLSLVLPPLSQNAVFFIKGKSLVAWKSPDGLCRMNQSYGFSYQLFKVQIDQKESGKNILLEIAPKNHNDAVELIGPFIQLSNGKWTQASVSLKTEK